MIAAASVSTLVGCAAGPEQVAGRAGPAGVAPTTVSAPASASTGPVTEATTTPRTSASPVAERTSTIRKTDWSNVIIKNLDFLGLGDAHFRGGKASSGATTCTMLPGAARPAYAEYLTEEPANSPVTEDALVLIECGVDDMQQALVPVQLGFDRKSRNAVGLIEADIPTGPDHWMTFTSYTVQRGSIVTTVRTTDGGKETRRYRFAGGARWKRA